jgi:polysaccharide chain length determinant protein (PEP-CTERM system associated)
MQDLQKTLELLIGYIRGVWVKKRYVMICSWLICPIGFIYVSSMPDVYEAQAKVYVDTRSVLQPLLKGLALQTDPQQEIAMMVRTLLSRPNLEIIARESDLDIGASGPLEYESLINSLSRDIRLKKLGSENLYSISFEHGSAEMARTVVQETLNLFVEGSKGNTRKGVDTASRFIDEQIDEYENRLSSAEQRRANFKRKYSDLLPNQGSFYSNYATLESLLEDTQLTIKETEQKIVTLAGQVDGNNSQVDGFSVHPSNVQSSLTTRFDTRIKTLEESLDQLKLKYTELYPDVIEAKNLLSSLKEARKKEIDEYLAAGSGEQTDQIGSIVSELKLEISRLGSQVASLKVREVDYSDKINKLRQKIDLVPQVEAERTALDRGYDLIKQKHSELLSRKDSAELAQRADVSSEDVQFKIIEPPLVPLDASGPNRIIFYTLVLIFGFGAGLGLAFLISQINPILIRASQLTTITLYPVLGVVSHLNRNHIKKVNRTRMLVFIFSSSVIISVYGVLVSAEILGINIYGRIFS